MVIGGGGFVASHLIDHALEQGDEIISTVRWNEDLSRAKHFEDKVKTVQMNLLDLSGIFRALADNKPEVISLLGAESWVPFSFSNPIVTIETNGIGTVNLFEAIRLIREYVDKDYDPLVHVVSSSEVYGKVKREDLPITENHPFNPGNPYAIGKVTEDVTAQFYNKYFDIKVIITRMFTHCGIRRTMMSAENFYAKSIAELEKKYNLKAPDCEAPNCTIEISDETGMGSIRTWADVRDAVKAYYKLFKDGKSGEVYNIAGETVKSIQEVLDHLISISKLDKDKIKFVVNPKFIRKVDVDKQEVDISKFKNDIDWSPEITFDQLMQNLLDYWRNNV